MDKQAVNKELKELMGLKYLKPTHGSCCTCQTCGHDNDDCICWIDYFEWEDYGVLRDMFDKWNFTTQIRFFTLVHGEKIQTGRELTPFTLLHAFHRDNLAPLMLEFLKQEG